MKNKKIFFYFLIFLIISSGIFFRFWKLDSIPPGIQYDEAYNGINALEALETGHFKIFYPENTGREGFHINVTALFVKFFGNTSLSLRIANAIWGSLALIGFFFLLRELKFSKVSVVLGTFMLSFSFWHLDFSRTAYRAIMVPMVIIWSFYFLFKALRNPKRQFSYFLATGALLGLGFNSYIAFRVVPLIFVIIGIFLVITDKNLVKNYWKKTLIVFLGLLIVAFPIFVYYSDHLKEFLFRADAVSIFNTSKMTAWQAFGKSLGAHLGAFFVHGDNNPRHNYNGQPLLPAGWSVLFAIGFIISLREIIQTLAARYQKRGEADKNNFAVTKWFYVSIIAQSIFWTMLIPGVLSIEGIPHSLRIIGTIPAVFILAALPFEYILSLRNNLKKSLGSPKNSWQVTRFNTIIYGLIFMVIFGGFSQVYIYFNAWAKDLRTASGYERKLYDLGLLIKNLPMHKNNYVITAFNTSITPDNKQSSLKTSEYLAYPKIKNYLFYKPMDGRSAISCEDPQLVFQESDQWLRDQYRERCPNLKSRRYTYDNEKYIFWVMGYDQ